MYPLYLALYHLTIGDYYVDFWFGLTAVFGVLALINGAILFWRERKKHKMLIPLGVALVIACLAMLFAESIPLAFWGDSYLHVGWFLYVLLAGFFLNAMSLSVRDIWKIAKILVVTATVMCLVSLLNNKFTDAIFFSEGYSKNVRNNFPYHGAFFNANHFAYYLTICTTLAAGLFVGTKKREKAVFGGCFVILAISMVLSNTVGGYFGLAAGLILLIMNVLRSNKKALWQCGVIVAVILLGCLIPWKDGSSLIGRNVSDAFGGRAVKEGRDVEISDLGTGRLAIWKDTIGYIVKKPVLGYGGNGLRVEFARDRKVPDTPHNLVLELAAYNGIVAAVLVVGFLIWLIINGIKRAKNDELARYLVPVVVAYLVSAMFGNMTFFVSPVFVIMLSLCYARVSIKEKCNEERTQKWSCGVSSN